MHLGKQYMSLVALSIIFTSISLLARHDALAANKSQELFHDGHLSNPNYCSLYDFVFIVSTGRSGSTTLMEFLNAVPGIHISGENDGLIHRLSELHMSMKNITTKKAVAWKNTFDISDIEQDMRNMVVHTINPPPNSKTIGFKEIRTRAETDFIFTRHLFPCAKFIVNFREDVSSQSQSGFYKRMARIEGSVTSITDSLTKSNEFLRSLVQKHQDYMLLATLEDFSIETFDRILIFLGFSDCRTLQIPYLNKQSYTSNNELKPLGLVDCKNEQQHTSAMWSVGQLAKQNAATGIEAQPQSSRHHEEKAPPNKLHKPSDSPSTPSQLHTSGLPLQSNTLANIHASLGAPQAPRHPLVAEKRKSRSEDYRCSAEGVQALASSQDPWAAVAERSVQEPSIAICALIRNEALNLDEWIAFHWLQGVRKFFLYDDQSMDETSKILEKYVKRNIVDHRIVNGSADANRRGKAGTDTLFQMNNLNECLTEAFRMKKETGIDWVLFTDADEFAYAKHPNMTLAQAIDAQYEREPCVALLRTDFGTSGHIYRPKTGLVIENYLLSSHTYRDMCPEKMIVNLRPENATKSMTKFGNSPHMIHPSVKSRGGYCLVDEVEHLQINQYLRSLEDFNHKVTSSFFSGTKKYADPLLHFWKRDFSGFFDDIAPQRFACEVRVLLMHWMTTLRDQTVTIAERKSSSVTEEGGLAVSGGLNHSTMVAVELNDLVKTSYIHDSSPIVIRKFRLIFFHLPKVASGEFKKLFRRVEGLQDWSTSWNSPSRLYFPDRPRTTLPHDGRFNGLTYLQDLPFPERDKIFHDPSWTKAIFLRDPMTRFVSAYLDKIRRHHPNAEMRKISFEEFITKVETGMKDTHWNPQSQFYDLDKWLPVMDFVGSFENLAEDTETLLRKLGAWEEFGADGWGEDGASAMFHSNTSNEDNVRKYYRNATTKERVMILMAPDFKHAGTKIA